MKIVYKETKQPIEKIILSTVGGIREVTYTSEILRVRFGDGLTYAFNEKDLIELQEAFKLLKNEFN